MSKSIIEPRILKGTREFLPQEMAKRQFVMAKMSQIFERFGYDSIETPILAPAEVLLGKYGEEGDKLTYHFNDAGDRHIALPYDLTVPFARMYAANWQELPMPFKRYQIQRVWRAEKPQKGRLREFYQCDIDIIGTRSLMADAEIAKVTLEIFDALGIENCRVKVNSRRLMNAVLDSFNFSEDHNSIIRIIDKIDKIGKEAVKEELVKFGLDEKDVSRLFEIFNKRDFADYDTSEIDDFLRLCLEFGVGDRVDFDPYLARGLDYYTGIIYEAICDGTDFGSLAGGGRYDDLCGLFCKEDFSGVGISFGFERIMLVLEQLGQLKDISLSSQVLVTLFDESSSADALATLNKLTESGINAEVYPNPDKLAKQFKYANKKLIPFVVVRGPEEIDKNEATVKDMSTGDQKTVSYDELTACFS